MGGRMMIEWLDKEQAEKKWPIEKGAIDERSIARWKQIKKDLDDLNLNESFDELIARVCKR